jgi:hypothetical protein
MLARRSSLPDSLDPDLTARALLIEDNLTHDEAYQPLALGCRRRYSVPNAWQVLARMLQCQAIDVVQNQGLLALPAGMVLLDRLQGAQLLLPNPLQRARNKTVLGFDRILLTACPLGLVAGAFTPQTPLSRKLLSLPLDLFERGDGDGDPVRRGGIEQDLRDHIVDRLSTDLLAERSGTLITIDPAAIDRVIAARTAVAQAHATHAAPAQRDALEESEAAAARQADPPQSGSRSRIGGSGWP